MTATGEAAADNGGIAIEVLRGNPTEDELAALIAVVGIAYQTEIDGAVAEDEPARSAWAISARGLREPLRRELGWTAR